ncbi:hypothetical protein [Nocardia sp. XZ_19_369]|uniref:hypothetical protein n=1 Tax=Nocardia sp. XZ_19_369 TaxID=2769487 RepID=UPI0018906DDD|nr:hypothetical protein [Nocardia sp. XZ_19_369]
MSLDIYVIGRGDVQDAHFGDDAEESFLRMCQAAPDDTLRRGVVKHGRTMFNPVQLRRFVAELEALPAAERTPVVREVEAAAHLAIRSSGCLLIVGE